ncbi:MAG: wax ester/triacylglycerol synthase family O-acyltransferase [Actinomycetota bacterium]|nr:wax ester/triacylglycerol synthase family O-acyltransferase [Actinomycetota bacterium]
MLEPLSGLDAAFLSMETPTGRLHVAGVLVLDPPEGETRGPDLATRRFDEIRAVVGERVGRVPRLLRRAVHAPWDLQRPVWVESPGIDLDVHVRRATVAAPGGPSELDALVGELLSRPLALDRPLWEMVVADGLAGGRTAVVARLHHAILDGVSGATAMAAFLDLAPDEPAEPAEPKRDGEDRADALTPEGPAGPSTVAMWKYAVSSFAHQLGAAGELLQRSADAVVALSKQNRDLLSRGLQPPPAPFSAPRTPLNGAMTPERCFASSSVPLADLELVRRDVGAHGKGEPVELAVTMNDVILAVVGGALRRYVSSRGELLPRPLVALVPVSTRGHPSVPSTRRAHVGNYVSGMLVPLATTIEDPIARLHAIAAAGRVAKRQESVAGGELLESLLRVVPPLVVSAVMRAVDRFSLFDRLPPPANVVVSSVLVPDVSLWWAGSRVSAVYPAGPVADGVGLNITSMTYRGTVHFGVVSCPSLVPDVHEVASHLHEAVAELVAAASA